MGKRQFEDGPEFPKFLDNNDKLGRFRQRFYMKKGSIYMCGNSLGLLSKDAEESILYALEKWKVEGVKMWNYADSKYHLYPNYLAELTAPLIKADPDEITVMGCTTSNIHQAVSTLYKPTEDKYKIIVDDINFPTDKYAIDSQVQLKGYDPKEAVKIVKSVNGKLLNEDDVISAMTEDIAMVFLPAVYYRTAQVVDMKRISEAAKERGILVGWDLCHAIGSIEIDLKSCDADFAVWCNYKYMNGGPGASAGFYINKRHFKTQPGMAGWFGNKPETQFLLKQEYEHEDKARGFLLGCPAVLSMAGTEGSLKMMNEAGISEMRQKSLNITAYLMYLIDNKLADNGFAVGNLRDDNKRGGHVCLEHDEAYRISMALKKQGVVPDFRDPNVIRLTPTALYTTYSEVYDLVEIILDIAKNKKYEEFDMKRSLVV